MLNDIFEFDDLLLRALFILPAIVAGYLATTTSRTPQGAVGWIVLILAYPFVGVPAYALLGWANYAKFAERRRASDARLGEVDATPRDAPVPADRLDVFSRLSGNKIDAGCDMKLMVDGEATFDVIEAVIREAEHYVLVQFYTFADDEIGRRIQAACIERAKAGVQVFFLHDEMPLLGLPRHFMAELRSAGIQTARPKGPTRALGPFQLNYRNHRKLVVADGTTALTGGLNCSKTYIGKSNYGPWRDTFARVDGPVVDQLERSFASDWAWATGHDIRPILRPAPRAGDMRAVAVPIAPTDTLNTGNLYFIALAQQARERLWIATPYFVPDSQVMAALQLAALRGVDLRLLVPDRPDHRLPWWAAFSYFDELRAAGGEIYRYTPAFMHSKVALVDDDLSSVGSVNLDIRSGLLNFELTVIVESTEAAVEVEAMFLKDFENSYRLETSLSDQPAWRRILARIARLAAPQL
ncbi:cardiolipin synthase [Palleronia sp.]|uniref:cardiolipin synthase n=1 Tax=Palleronia sp. TaxID=1940284 RepID=UPI0035C7BD1F